ncbi:hypothetical protein OSTOST_06115 [Ostertagia ostertagi]
MSLFSTILSPVTGIFFFLWTNVLLILFTLMISGVLAFMISYYLYGYSSSPQSRSSSSDGSPTRISKKRSSTIHESDEDLPGAVKSAKPDIIELRRMPSSKG